VFVVTISKQIDQITVAVRYVRSRLAGIPIVLGGHSAGAHLTIMAYYRLLLANDAADVAGRVAAGIKGPGVGRIALSYRMLATLINAAWDAQACFC